MFDPINLPFSVRIKEDVFKDALNGILETYLRCGFKRIVVINGRGGGTEWMIEVIHKLSRRESTLWPGWKIPDDAKVVTFEYFAFLEVFAPEEMSGIRKTPPGSDWHDGDIETALQLYLHPFFIRSARLGNPMGLAMAPSISKFSSTTGEPWVGRIRRSASPFPH